MEGAAIKFDFLTNFRGCQCPPIKNIANKKSVHHWGWGTKCWGLLLKIVEWRVVTENIKTDGCHRAIELSFEYFFPWCKYQRHLSCRVNHLKSSPKLNLYRVKMRKTVSKSNFYHLYFAIAYFHFWSPTKDRYFSIHPLKISRQRHYILQLHFKI